MKSILSKILKPLASLRLTVILLALSMVVVFAGTVAQIRSDVWTVQKRFFHSFFLWLNLTDYFPSIGRAFLVPVMLGGYSLIALLLINLLAAHSVRFKINRKRIGILLIHAGLILLIAGEIVTSLFQREGQMVIDEGQTVNFTQDIRECELAVIDPSSPDHDVVTVIPASKLARKGIIHDSRLPFPIRIDAFYANSEPVGPFQLKQSGRKPEAQATVGPGTRVAVISAPPSPGTEEGQNFPSIFVTPIVVDGRPLDTYQLSTLEMAPEFPRLNGPQQVQVGDRKYLMQLRWKRTYRPYAITLLHFTHERYTGTDVPKDFASQIRLTDPSRGTDREVRIWMNHPLRYAGETFYQGGFKPGDKTTILQVVKNPGWLIPYVSCSMIALGMLIHFGAHLISFLKRRANSPTPVAVRPDASRDYVLQPRPGSIWPALITLACFVYLLSVARPPKERTAFDLRAFSEIPISYEGRVMPLDSLARNSLRIISGRDTLFVEDPSKLTWFHRMFSLPAGNSYPANFWLLNTMSGVDEAGDYRIFRIDHPDIVGLLGLDSNRTRFSVNEIARNFKQLEEQLHAAFNVPAKKRDLYQRKLVELGNHLMLYQKLQRQLADLYFAPPLTADEDWQTVGEAIHQSDSNATAINPGVTSIATLLHARDSNQTATFNATAADYLSWFKSKLPGIYKRVVFETLFNRVEPFYNSMILYVLVFVLICASWLIFPATLQRAALWVLILTLAFHSLGLIARIYIQGRPPVTNLYSSAIFIAWGAAVMCLGLELMYRNGIGTIVAAAVGFLSLLVAQNLAGSGDTMQMLQAVLDTNIWLATHVVVITLGYASTFLAGCLAAFYVIRGVLTRSLDADDAKSSSKMIYGIICFAMLFSFVGTILGGIWADQSWGRFWGWDPKENGAVLIVLWNALMLHARWGGLVRERGVALLAIFGNIVTAWSWFGTNMLGIGLHSYGFMDSAIFWLGLWISLQLALIALGTIPLHRWRSFSRAN